MLSSKENAHVAKRPGSYPLDLLINNRRAISIEGGLAGDTKWTNGDTHVFFDMTMHDDYFDLGGPEDHSYSPRGKPAWEEWKRWAKYEPK